MVVFKLGFRKLGPAPPPTDDLLRVGWQMVLVDLREPNDLLVLVENSDSLGEDAFKSVFDLDRRKRTHGLVERRWRAPEEAGHF